MTKHPRALSGLFMFALAGGFLLGCGNVAEPGAEEVTGEIIGGSPVDVATRRSLGLVDVNGGCSGSLIDANNVLTAVHCLDLVTPGNNTASIPETNGVMDGRVTANVVRVGGGDIAVLKLAGSPPATWPSVTRAESTVDPSASIGASLTCYGRGNTAYVPDGGLTGFGAWRKLTHTINDYIAGENLFIMNTPDGNQITAPGDSGGGCFSGTRTTAIVSAGTWNCGNPKDGNTCKNTITQILNARLSATATFNNYIDQSRTRTAMSFQPLTLANGWTDQAFGTNYAGVAKGPTANMVYFKGGVSGGSDATMFKLPAGFTPPTLVYVPVTLSSAAKGRLVIFPDGTVQVEGEKGFGDARNFTSLDGASFSLSASGTTSVPLANGWTNAPFNTRSVRVANDGGIIRFQGAMATTGTSALPFVMPLNFRPSTTVYLPVDMCGATKGRVRIDPSGQATVTAETSQGNANCFTSLEGVSFPVSAGGWTQLPPENGWTSAPFSTRSPAVSNHNGIVTFQGAIATGTTGVALSLPFQFRPAIDTWVEADLCGATKGLVKIEANGDVSVQSNGTFSNATCFTSLESVQFAL